MFFVIIIDFILLTSAYKRRRVLLNWLYIQLYICIAQTRAIFVMTQIFSCFTSDSFTHWTQINQDIFNFVDLIHSKRLFRVF